jgi:hypothetical protein
MVRRSSLSGKTFRQSWITLFLRVHRWCYRIVRVDTELVSVGDAGSSLAVSNINFAVFYVLIEAPSHAELTR